MANHSHQRITPYLYVFLAFLQAGVIYSSLVTIPHFYIMYYDIYINILLFINIIIGFTSGIIFGWPALEAIFIKHGVYRGHCKEDDVSMLSLSLFHSYHHPYVHYHTHISFSHHRHHLNSSTITPRSRHSPLIITSPLLIPTSLTHSLTRSLAHTYSLLALPSHLSSPSHPLTNHLSSHQTQYAMLRRTSSSSSSLWLSL